MSVAVAVPVFILPLVAFWLLFAATALTRAGWTGLKAKPWRDWVLDGAGLLVQGTLVPALQLSVVVGSWATLAPGWQGALDVPGAAAFLLNFVLVDWLYYWNHRLLHTRALWPLHRVHHSMTARDVLGTSRNTLYSSFFIVYLWVNGSALYLLADPAPYVVAAAVTAALDLWRHSAFGPRRGTAAYRLLSRVLVLPSDHAWHHSAEGHGNYGANLSWWDRLHGTWLPEADEATDLGIDPGLSLPRRLLWPFGAR